MLAPIVSLQRARSAVLSLAMILTATAMAGATATATPLSRLQPLGTNGGNDFKHFVNPGFDFHIGTPKEWVCDGCENDAPTGPGDTEVVWKFKAPEPSTWITVSFISPFPASTQAELKAEIERRHSGADWYDFGRGAFVGYSTSALGDAAPKALEYYLIAKQQVVKIEWETDVRHPTRVAELARIRDSIDRASLPPRIRKILSAPIEAYKPGNVGCIFVLMDDLRMEFNDEDVQDVQFEGAPEHYSFKRIRWVPENGWFEVCIKVTTAFGRTGLRIKRFSLSTDAHVLNCSQMDSDPDKLECITGLDVSSTGVIVEPEIAKVDNQTPDSEGPVIHGVELDPGALTLKIRASDATGVAYAEVLCSGRRLLFYPDELRSAAAVDLRPLLQHGWNVIDRIVVYDTNGLPTALRVGAASNRRAARPDQEMYELMSWNGQVQTTNIPIIAHLVAGGAL